MDEHDRPLRFLQLTDPHLHGDPGATLLGLNTRDSFEAVLQLAKTLEPTPDAVLVTGDLAQDFAGETYRWLAQRLATFGVPYFWIPGNHDDPSQAAAHLRCERHAILGRWQVILLDTHVPGAVHGFLNVDELRYLKQCLVAYPGHHALVCLHHHPVPMGSRWLDDLGLKNSTEFFSVLDEHPCVRGVLWGHVHQEYYAKRGNVTLLAGPSTCFQFTPGSVDFDLDSRKPGCQALTLHPDGCIEHRVHRADHFALTLDRSVVGY